MTNKIRLSPNIMILGHADHGKTTIAKQVVALKPEIKFIDSSQFAMDSCVLPEAKKLVPDITIDDIKKFKPLMREFMCWAIKKYCVDDRAKLGKDIFEQSDMYVGCRSQDEYQAQIDAGLIDLTFYVKNINKVENDPSMEIGFDPFTMILLQNDGKTDRCAEVIIEESNLWVQHNLIRNWDQLKSAEV